MIGVLVMAYGGPNNLDEVEPYLLDVRGGRPTPAEIVTEIRGRYRQIGGSSPILRLTRSQAEAVEAALNRDGAEFKAFVGMRHWRPYIQDALAEMESQGIRRAVGLVMAPHYSRMSVEVYYQKAMAAGSPVELARIESWHILPGYIDALAARVQAGLEKFSRGERERVHVLYTAHSLPERIRAWNDPYPDQLRETVAGVAGKLGSRSYSFAYQSAGRTPEPWLGPAVDTEVERLVREGCLAILVAPIGFVCDHVEVLYDIDIELKQQAARLGARLERIELVNTAPEMIAGLAGLVRTAARRAGWTEGE